MVPSIEGLSERPNPRLFTVRLDTPGRLDLDVFDQRAKLSSGESGSNFALKWLVRGEMWVIFNESMQHRDVDDHLNTLNSGQLIAAGGLEMRLSRKMRALFPGSVSLQERISESASGLFISQRLIPMLGNGFMTFD